MNENNRKLAFLTSIAALVGAAFQSGNNIAAGFLRSALRSTNPWQSLFLGLVISFLAAFLVGIILWLILNKPFEWRLESKNHIKWHLLRLIIGFGATILIFSSSQDAISNGTSVGLITLLASTGPIYLGIKDLIAGYWSSMPVVVLGFAGIVIASSQALGGGSEVSIVLRSLLGGFLLALLALIQSHLVKKMNEHPAKIVGVFGGLGFVISLISLWVTCLISGVPHIHWGIAFPGVSLAVCYGASQILIQLANGFGNPVLIGVLGYTSVIDGYVLDFIIRHQAPSIAKIVGSSLVLAAAMLAVLIGSRRTPR